jgi:hypothetical protein
VIVIKVVIVLPIFKLKPTQQVRTNEHKSIFSSVLFDATSAPVADIFTQSACLADFSRKSQSTVFHATGNLFCFELSQVMVQ